MRHRGCDWLYGNWVPNARLCFPRRVGYVCFHRDEFGSSIAGDDQELAAVWTEHDPVGILLILDRFPDWLSTGPIPYRDFTRTWSECGEPPTIRTKRLGHVNYGSRFVHQEASKGLTRARIPNSRMVGDYH